MTREIVLTELTYREDENSIFLVHHLPEYELPVAQIVPRLAFVDRAVHHDLDPQHPEFHRTVLRICLHEAHTPAGVHQAGHRRQGQVHDLAAADAHTRWVISDAHHAEARRLKVIPKHVTEWRLILAGEHPLPPIPRNIKLPPLGALSAPVGP